MKGVTAAIIKLGYFFSAVSKPMMAASVYPLWIFFSRTIDRLGKELGTAARDALLSQNATKEPRARVFEFHRGMDTMGAAIGPAIALLLLIFYPHNYKSIFLFAFIPGMTAVALIYLLKEKRQFFSFFRYWTIASAGYKKLVTGLLFLAYRHCHWLYTSCESICTLLASIIAGAI